MARTVVAFMGVVSTFRDFMLVGVRRGKVVAVISGQVGIECVLMRTTALGQRSRSAGEAAVG